MKTDRRKNMSKRSIIKPTATAGHSAVKTQELKARLLESHEIVLAPAAQSGIGVLGWSKFAGDPDPSKLCQEIQDEIKKVSSGDMRPVEGMLFGQALALQTIFTALSRRAGANETLKQVQVNLTLALKAQAQCRATLEALAELKNPRPVSFVKQANISHGHQQVNNHQHPENRPVRAGAHVPARENTALQNKLMEHHHGERMDTGASSTAIASDPHLETVGKVNGTKHG
jgi:hypothetical protein